MKTLVFLSISILICNNLLCQLNDSIVDKNKIWYNNIFIYNTMWVDTEVMVLDSDTTLNDTSYCKVLRAKGGIEIPSAEYGYIRSENGKVYYRTHSGKPERLITDFSIHEGDTVIVYGLINRDNDEFIECQYVCDSIRSKQFFEVNRKVFYLKALIGLVPEKWIEGIGSTSGLLHNWDGRVGGDAFYLSCVKSEGSYLFRQNESEPCIKIALGVKNQTQKNPDLFPNPISKGEILNIINSSPGSIIVIYNAMGRLIHRQILNSSMDAIKPDFEPGIYIFQIIDKNNVNVKFGKLIFE